MSPQRCLGRQLKHCLSHYLLCPHNTVWPPIKTLPFTLSAVSPQAQGTLCEARVREMTSTMPPIHFLPSEMAQGESTDATTDATSVHGGEGQRFYECPLYKTSVRAGVLSTTGQSTNFVLHIRLPLPVGVEPQQSIMQGVAALCALNN